MEALLFVLSSESHFCESLTSEQFGFEVLGALEVFRRRIDEVYGPGSFLTWRPWKELIG